MVLFTGSQLRRRKIKDILHSGDAYKSILTPSLPPPPPFPPCLTQSCTQPFCHKILPNQNCTLLQRTCLCTTQEDSSQVKTYLTVKTSQVCKCKLFVSVSFLDYAQNFLLKVKLKGNKLYVIYLYSPSKEYKEIFFKKNPSPKICFGSRNQLGRPKIRNSKLQTQFFSQIHPTYMCINLEIKDVPVKFF